MNLGIRLFLRHSHKITWYQITNLTEQLVATFKHHAIMFTLRIAAVEDGLLASSVVPAAKQLVTGYKIGASLVMSEVEHLI